MKFLIRFLVFFCVFFLTEASHTKAHGHQHVITHASLPFHKAKAVVDIAISSNETNEEDENDNDRKFTELNRYLTNLFSQASFYLDRHRRYCPQWKYAEYTDSSWHILLRVIRI